MSDRQGVLCLVILVLAAAAAVSAIAAGSLMIGWVGLAIYLVSGVLVIRYIAE